MTTTTTRYALTKLATDGSDSINVVIDFNNNWDSLDLKLGTQVCTSTTRPSSPVQGMTIYETDTLATRVYKGSAWQTVGNSVSTSGARPANPIQGDMTYESDTTFMRTRGAAAWNGILAVATSTALPAAPIQGDLAYLSDKDCIVRYSGSAWKLTGIVACTSTTRPTLSLWAGLAIYETDTGRFLTYNGASWAQTAYANFNCTSSTHPASPFTGLEIFETDTGLSAVYNGSGYNYAVQQIAPTQVLGSTTASVTFSSIPAVTRLILEWRGRQSSTGGVDLLMQLDGNTGSNYTWAKNESVNGGAPAGSHAGALTTSMKIGVVAGNTASYFSSGHQKIDGWNQATGFCTCTGPYGTFDTAAADWVGTTAGQFAVVGPHTSLKLTLSANSFVAGSQFSLYGAM